MAEPAAVRVAMPEERPAIARMLARAFHDDPVFSFIYPDPAVRARRLPRFFDLVLDEPGGLLLVTAGGEAATLWQPPGTGRDIGSVWQRLRLLLPLIHIFGTAIPRAMRVGDAVAGHHPRAPHWYLYIAGCDPAHQGRGLGTAAIRAGLERVGPSPAYLETAKEANLALYQRLGFRVTQDWRVPRHGPQFWSMWRDAAPQNI